MRICYIADGGSIHNHFMADWFKNRGHDLLFLTDTPEGAPGSCRTVEVAPRKGGGVLRHLKAARRARQEIALWKPDIVHAHNITGYGYWGWLSGFKPFVATAWGSDLYLLARKNWLIYQGVKRTLRRADLVTADSNRLCQAALAIGGDRLDVRTLQWGVDLNEFSREIDPALRRRFRGGAEFVLISPRRLRPIYNIDVMIEAFAVALPSMPNSRLVIVGDDCQRPELERQAARLHLGDRVCFTGWLERDEYVAALRSADACLSVPTSDSTALTLLEAFASRLLVVASDLPDNREWIAVGENGLLVDPGQIVPLKDAMIDHYRHRQSRQSWLDANDRMVRERGDRDQEMARLEQWYRELIRKP